MDRNILLSTKRVGFIATAVVVFHNAPSGAAIGDDGIAIQSDILLKHAACATEVHNGGRQRLVVVLWQADSVGDTLRNVVTRQQN